MKKYITIAALGLTLSAFGQANTNLTAQLNGVFLNLSPSVQASTLATFADYNRAVRFSPEWKGVSTNISYTYTYTTNGNDVTITGTNTVTTVTTNHPAMTFVQWFQASLNNEKVSRVVQQYNSEMETAIIRSVGKTVVDGWGN